ncbi:hypothetical protein V6Z11_D01G009200 [Gossypium hirsutum]|uniref:Uncharacterized protein n=1 Tax=Gossypium tomentosum TaxID=34277 RepID=A0A5D2M3X6_GOSTO|nr:hypothetical protein ES332_D01G011300v1 [Gossypium tomentosum]
MDSGDAASSSAKAEVVPSTLSESSATELLNFSTSFDLKVGFAIIFLKCSPMSDIMSSGMPAHPHFVLPQIGLLRVLGMSPHPRFVLPQIGLRATKPMRIQRKKPLPCYL